MKRPVLTPLAFALAALLGSGSLPAASPAAAAADFPARPIQIVVPYSAGGGTDVTTRLMGSYLEKYLEGTIVVRNQPGGGGAIGTGAVAHAKPDGYTLGMGAQGPLAMLPHYGGIDYGLENFDFLALVARNLMLIGVNKDAPFQDAQGFFDYAKAHPGEITIGNSGAGGANHIAVEGLARAAGIKVKSMPFGGSSAAITACLGGHIMAVAAHPSELLNPSKSGEIKVILALEDRRIEQFPEVPTAGELGVDFGWAAWKGVVAPKGLPDEVRARLTNALDQVFRNEEFLQKMEELGEYVDYREGADYEALAQHDSEVALAIIRSLGMHQMNVRN